MEAFTGGGGHSHWKVVWGCAAIMTPFLQASRRSLAYQFTINAPLMCSPFAFFFLIAFSTLFWPKFQLSRCKFSKFLLLRPPFFFKENPLLRPYFWKFVWHTPTKKKLSARPWIYQPQILSTLSRADVGICLSV